MKYKEEFEELVINKLYGIPMLDKDGDKYCLTETQELYEYFIAGIELKEQDGWISVKDRLPDENVRVIARVYCNKKILIDAHEHIHHLEGYYSNEWWDSFHERFEDDDLEVTHWMPLPEPPVSAVKEHNTHATKG